MKSNQRLLSLLFVLFSFAAFAQPKPTEVVTGSVSGVVMDNQLNQPIPYATVVIVNPNGETLTGGITNDDGVFEIKKVNEYAVFHRVGYCLYCP